MQLTEQMNPINWKEQNCSETLRKITKVQVKGS